MKKIIFVSVFSLSLLSCSSYENKDEYKSLVDFANSELGFNSHITEGIKPDDILHNPNYGGNGIGGLYPYPGINGGNDDSYPYPDIDGGNGGLYPNPDDNGGNIDSNYYQIPESYFNEMPPLEKCDHTTPVKYVQLVTGNEITDNAHDLGIEKNLFIYSLDYFYYIAKYDIDKIPDGTKYSDASYTSEINNYELSVSIHDMINSNATNKWISHPLKSGDEFCFNYASIRNEETGPNMSIAFEQINKDFPGKTIDHGSAMRVVYKYLYTIYKKETKLLKIIVR